MSIGNLSFRALYDTGASPNCLHQKVFDKAKELGKVLKTVGKMLIRTADGKTVNAPVVVIEMSIAGRTRKSRFAVLPQCSSDIILGMTGIHAWGIDYLASTNEFSFANRADANSKTMPDTSASVHPAKRQNVAPRTRSHLTCVVISQLNGAPVRNTEIIATVQHAHVLTRTDEHGRFSVAFTNPSPFTMEFLRTDILGLAENSSAVELLGEVTEKNVSAVLQYTARHSQAAASVEQQKQAQPPADQQVSMQERILKAIAHLDKPAQQLLQPVLRKFESVISKNKFDLGLTNLYTHQIHLTDSTPVYHKQFPIPVEHAPVIEEHVERWLQLGVVEPAQSPYNSPVFCVKKKDGGFRLCLDYRALNAKSLPENYSIRTPEDCIAQLGQAGAKHFIALDLSSGFYQMPLSKKSRPYTAFTVPKHGQLQWTRGAMGLKGCPGSFARLMDMALQGLPNVLVYIDDVLVYGQTKEEACHALNKVLQRLQTHNLKINLDKSTFFHKETPYLGYTLSTEGIFPGKDKTQAILQAQPPQTRKQLKSFLGMINYYRNFVRHFAHKAGKLYALTRQDSKWRSGPLPPYALEVFEELKKLIVKTVPRSFPFREGKYHLFTDGSLGDHNEEGGLGGHLMQEDAQGKLHSIGWASRALAKHERNYSSFLLELQSAVWNVEYFSHYLKGRTFTLYTDHAPLTKLSTVHSRTLHRLHNLLNEYSFEIRHIAGKKNAVADFLSRSHGPAAIAAMAELHNMRALQDNDQTLGPIIANMLAHKPLQLPPSMVKQTNNISLHKGVLCIKLPPRPGYPDDDKWRVIVPQELQKILLQEAHNSALGGHQGIYRTLERIKLSFWWPNMESQVASHVKHCTDCQATNAKNKPKTLPNQELPQTRFPNERVHADLFGPLKDKDGQQCFVLGITDSFTKILRLAVIPNKEAKTVAWGMWEHWMTIYGIPKLVVTDQGNEFCNALEKAIYDCLKVEHRTTTPYWPRCNMQEEHNNKTLQQYMRTILYAAKKSSMDWQLYLPALMLSLNTAVNKAIKMSPFKAMFGYDPRIPLYADLDILNEDEYRIPAEDKDTFYAWQDTQRAARQAAHANDRHFKDTQFLTQQNPLRSFKAKENVWVKIQAQTQPNKKFAPQFEPAIIIQRTSQNTYKIRRLLAKQKKIVTVNAEHLKPRSNDAQVPEDDDTLEPDDDIVTAPHLGMPAQMTEPEDEFSPDLTSMKHLAAVRFRDDRGYSYNLDEWIGRKQDHTAEEIKEIFMAVAADSSPEDYSLLVGKNQPGRNHQQQQQQQQQQMPPPPPPMAPPPPPSPPPQQQPQQLHPVLLPQQQQQGSPPRQQQQPQLQQQLPATATPHHALDTSDEQSFITPTQETPPLDTSPTRAGPRSRPAERTPSPEPSTSTPAARSSSSSRRTLTFSPEATPPQRQQQQQHPVSPFMPPRVAVAQPSGTLPPPNTWQFRQARAAARNYQATRIEARQRFLAMAEARAPASVMTNQQQLAQWRQHHEAIFAALNPRPAEIFNAQLLQQEVLAETSPWEQQYSAQMARLLQEHPPVLVSNPREAQQLYQPQAAQRRRRQ